MDPWEEGLTFFTHPNRNPNASWGERCLIGICFWGPNTEHYRTSGGAAGQMSRVHEWLIFTFLLGINVGKYQSIPWILPTKEHQKTKSTHIFRWQKSKNNPSCYDVLLLCSHATPSVHLDTTSASFMAAMTVGSGLLPPPPSPKNSPKSPPVKGTILNKTHIGSMLWYIYSYNLVDSYG